MSSRPDQPRRARSSRRAEGLRHAPKKLNAPTTRQGQLLKQVRHHIQHMDEKLEKGHVSRRYPIHLVVPTPTSIVIGTKVLPYRDLASCITKMYRNIEILRQAPSK